MPVRRTRNFKRDSVRRQMQWVGASVATTTIPAGTAVLHSVLGAGALLLRPFTIVRTHLVLHWENDVFTATERPFGAYGEIVVTDNASGVGITAVPDPDSDFDADWHTWQGLISAMLSDTSVGITMVGQQYQVDSKAMRKVGANDDAISVVTNTSTVGAKITTRGRFLVKLH